MCTAGTAHSAQHLTGALTYLGEHFNLLPWILQERKQGFSNVGTLPGVLEPARDFLPPLSVLGSYHTILSPLILQGRASLNFLTMPNSDLTALK